MQSWLSLKKSGTNPKYYYHHPRKNILKQKSMTSFDWRNYALW